jgi:diguanylate cyclase (GGDEF)-like protein
MSRAGVAEDGRAEVPSLSAHVRRAMLLASIDALEISSRFSIDGVAGWARQLATEADELALTEVRLRTELVHADLFRRHGDLPQAAGMAQRVHRWATDHSSPRLLGRSAYILAAVLQELGDLAMALEMAVTAVDLLDDAVPAALYLDHHVRLADCLGLNGDAAAGERYDQALRMARELRDTERELLVLNNWAYSEALAGRYETAIEISEQLQARAAEHGAPLSVARLDTIGRALIGAGQLEAAVLVLGRGLQPNVLAASADGDDGADFLLTLAEAHRLLGHLDMAQRYLDDCVGRCDRHGLTAIRVRARREQAALHAATGDYRAAYTEHVRYSDQLSELQSAQRDARARAMQAMYEANEARRQTRRYRELSLRDPLTGLYNRRHVDEELPRLLQAGTHRPLTVALIDLDHFKRINDTCSHETGDEVLRTIGGLLQAAVPAADASGNSGSFAARMGGEEFLLVLTGPDATSALERLEALRRTVHDRPWNALTGRLPVTISIGATTTDGAGQATAAELLSRADAQLYSAKRQGRDRVVADRFGREPS